MGLPSVALIYLVPVSILTGFAVGLCALRMYTRVKTRKFYIDDWLILAAVVCLYLFSVLGIRRSQLARTAPVNE